MRILKLLDDHVGDGGTEKVFFGFASIHLLMDAVRNSD